MATYNVMDFGAVGDGVHDDRPAIQAAINAAEAAGGGTVFMAAGTYSVTKSAHSAAIELPDNVTLQGAGMGATTIKLANHQEAMAGIVRTPYGVATHDAALLDLTIDGNCGAQTEQQNGFFSGVIPGSPLSDENITVERVEIKDCNGYGFDPHEVTTNLLLEDCVSHGNRLEGFTLDDQIDAVVRNCVAYDNDVHGFLVVTNSDGVLFENCEAYGNGSSGLTVGSNSANIEVRGGSFHDNDDSGIYLRDSQAITIEGAAIYGNQQTGITVGGVPNVVIRDNDIFDNSQSGNGRYSQVLLTDWTDKVSQETFGATGVVVEDNRITATGPILPKWGIEERGVLTDGNSQAGNTISGETHGPTEFRPDPAGDSWIVSTNADAKISAKLLAANDSDPDGQALTVTGVGGAIGGTVGFSGGVVDFKAAAAGPASFTYSVSDGNGGSTNGLVHVTVVQVSEAADVLRLDTPLGASSFVDGRGGNDSLTGGDAYDVLSGGDGDDRLDGRGGSDLLSGGNGDDDYYVGTSGDVVVEWYANGAGGTDTVHSSVDNTLAANVEKLILLNQAAKGTGNDLGNTITGDGAANLLDGKGGDDTLNGAGGNDVLTGGAGKDRFKFGGEWGHDTITDFADSTDRLDLRDSGLSYSDLSIGASGADATISYAGNEIVVTGQAGHISDKDFLFA